jgi:hypothetical protein
MPWSSKGGKGGKPQDPYKVDESQTRIDKGLRDASEAVDDLKDQIVDDTESLKTFNGAVLDVQRALMVAKPNTEEYVKAQEGLTKALRAQHGGQKKLDRDYEHLADAQDNLRIAGDKSQDPNRPGGLGGSNAASAFGSSFLGGVAQSLGLSDVFGSKAPWEFGSVKAGLGLLNWAMSGLHPGKAFQGGAPPGVTAGGPPLPGLPGWGTAGSPPHQANLSGYVDNSITVNHTGPSIEAADLHPIMNSYDRNRGVANTPGAFQQT